MENLNDSKNINRSWENVKDNIETSAKEGLGLFELKQHKLWFDDECLHFLDQRKQAKMQWLQDPNQSNVDDLNNVRREANNHFRNKKSEYLKAKIDELETSSKIRNTRDLYRKTSDFKKGYQARTNVVKDEKGDLVTDSHSSVARWRDHDVRRTEIHTAQPLVPELESGIDKLNDTSHQVLIKSQQN